MHFLLSQFAITDIATGGDEEITIRFHNIFGRYLNRNNMAIFMQVKVFKRKTVLFDDTWDACFPALQIIDPFADIPYIKLQHLPFGEAQVGISGMVSIDNFCSLRFYDKDTIRAVIRQTLHAVEFNLIEGTLCYILYGSHGTNRGAIFCIFSFPLFFYIFYLAIDQ